MIDLYLYPPFGDLPSTSPFCIKVDCFLRMAGLAYARRYQSLPGGAPKGKLPYIVENGAKVADSGLIVEDLQRRHAIDLDAGLDDSKRELGHAFRRMMEESLYWAMVHSRWFESRNWPTVRRYYFAGLPSPVRLLVAALGRQRMRRQIWAHGMGRHTSEEIYALGRADIASLAGLLGTKPYMMGGEPTLLDATAYAFVASLLFAPINSPLSDQARAHSNLEAYADRMRHRYYSEP